MKNSTVLYIITIVFVGLMVFVPLNDLGVATMFLVTNLWLVGGMIANTVEDNKPGNTNE